MCSEDPQETWICAFCIGESFLRARIEKEGTLHSCDYCSEPQPCFTLEAICDVTERAVQEHFIRTPTEPTELEYIVHRHSGEGWYREGEEIGLVIEHLLQTRSAIANDIQQLLEERHADFEAATMGVETDFASESYYEERWKVDTDHLDTLWARFVSSLKMESRYVNHAVKETLDSIFSGVEAMEAGDDQSVIINAGPGSGVPFLYRARWCHDNEELEKILVTPDRELGPPPHRLSGSNRMSARGISVFYGASSAETAIPEIRPPVGCDVVSAEFTITRPLRLLNLPALESVREKGSMLDPDFIRKRAQATFLRTLSDRITDPVLPGDEDFRYIPTQVIAEYLADAPKLNLDGMLYPSVQQGSQESEDYNVVLFHKASRVRYLDLPPQKDCRVHYVTQYAEDDWEMDIRVTQTAESDKQDKPAASYAERFWQEDRREPALQIDLSSVCVHRINAVQYNYSTDTVKRNKHILSPTEPRQEQPVTPLWLKDAHAGDLP